MSNEPPAVAGGSRSLETVSSPRSEIQLAIGAVVTTIATADPDLALTVPPAVARFVVRGAEADIRVEAQWTDNPPNESGRLLFDSGGLWQLRDAGGRLAWTFTSPTFGRAPYKTAFFEPDLSAGIVHLHRPLKRGRAALSEPIYPLEYPLDEIVLTNWLALGRGAEVHACAVRDANGDGYLFLGHSGAGKSTIAGLWQSQPDVTVLSDDRVILRNVGGRIVMYGTPWHGDEELGAPASVPLTQGFFLRHAATNQLTSLRGATVAARLFACCFPPFFSPNGVDFTLAFLADVGRLIPFSELAFRPDPSVIGRLRATD